MRVGENEIKKEVEKDVYLDTKRPAPFPRALSRNARGVAKDQKTEDQAES